MRRITATPDEQLKEIKRGVVDLLPEEDFVKKLKESYEKDQPLKLKLGADPSRPDIHIGHAVVLQKLRLMQDFGHEVYFIIGDFTAMIGDPTGKSKTRPALTREEVVENAKSYAEQVGKVLDMEKTKVVFNNDWLSKLAPTDIIKLMAHTLYLSIY